MRGLLMFDSVSDLVFFKSDEALLIHLNSLAVKEGLIEVSVHGNEVPQVEKNVVLQLFAPLLASYKVMQSELEDSYRSFEMEGGISLVFEEILNHVIIGVKKSKDLSLLEWELKVFSSYVRMLYGPSLYLMKEPLARHSGIQRLHLLSIIIDKCREVKAEQQMFLVEAIQRLVVKPDVASTCVSVLQDALYKIRASHSNGIFNHSFFLVDYKLLALYSSRNSGDLPKDQMLLLIILANVLNRKLSNSSADCCSDHPKYDDDATAEIRGEGDDEEINSLLVFLKFDDQLVPHMMYVMNITSHVSLVMLCELAGKRTVASHLVSLIKVFHHLQMYPSSHTSFPSYQTIETGVKSFANSAKKMNATEEKEKYIRNIITKWELAKQNGIEEFLRCSSGNCPEPRLESSISALCETCKVAFGEIIIRPELLWETQCLSDDYRHIFSSVLKMTTRKLKPYLEYFKSEVMDDSLLSSYMADFPGLIHFIYVDRTNDCIVALSPIPDESGVVEKPMKEKVWDMVKFGRRHVDGINTFFSLWHMDEMHHFYSIWFEDSHGKRVVPTEISSVEDLPPKGILCGNFFKHLIQRCFPNASYAHIYCYELFCTYRETTSASEVMQQSRRLSSRLWEFSGACKTPLDLF